jgi:hypothetical protein
MPGKCEHGLTTGECLVCASPKYGALPAASQIETVARATINARDTYGWSPEADAAINKLRAVLADPAAPVAVDAAPELPPLPKPALRSSLTDALRRLHEIWSYTAEQMHEYGDARARAAIRAVGAGSREPLAKEQIVALWGHRSDGPNNSEIVSFARAIERAHGIAARGKA